jgi:hypothetical protein
MIRPPGVHVVEVDDVDLVDGDLAVYMLLSDGSTVGALLPLDELVGRAHTVIEGADAPAMREAPVLQ